MNPSGISTIRLNQETGDSAYCQIVVKMHTGEVWSWNVHNYGAYSGEPVGLNEFLIEVAQALR